MSRREKAALFAGFIALMLVVFGVVALVGPNAAPETASLPTLAQLPSETSTQPSTQTVTLLPATSTPDAVLSGMLPTEPPLPATETPVPTATPLTPTRPAATATTVQPPVVTAPPSVGIVPVTLPQPEPLPPPSDTTLVVTFAEDTTQAERAAYIDSLGAEVASEVDALNTVVLTVPEGFTASSAPDEDIVLAAEPDYYASVLDAPALDDPLAGGQYGLSTMGLAEAWAALPADAPRIVVAVIDTGICAAHPDLLSRVLPGYDFVTADADPADEHGHGCAVSGVIAAQANNGVGIAGVAPNAMIMPLRVLDASGVGTYSRIAEAIVYATDNGARIINLSLGGFNASAVLEGAVDYALSRGVLVVAAAGNTYGGQTMYPAAYPQTISVGAHDATLLPASFNPVAQTDVLAAGVSIPVLRLDGTFGTQSGTSFAAPHVSGALALALGQGRELSLSGAAVLYLGTGSPAPVLTPASSPTPGETPQADASAVPPPDTASRRETYQGLTTELSELFRAVVLGEAQAQAVVDQVFGLQISGSSVLVTIYLQDASYVESVSAAVNAAGGTVSDSFSYVMDASLPIDQLVNIGSQPGVTTIDANRPPITLDDDVPTDSQADGEQGASAQAATTQGVAASNANVWHAANYRGSGIKVAVIDAGFFDYTGRQASGELPPGARLVAYTTPLGTGSTHGTNVAEIVYDMAPDATIYLAVPTGLGNFGNLVQDLACNQGVKVIQSSIGYMAQTPADGSGFFSEALAAARNCGALYVQAAGNAGVNHWDMAAAPGDFSGRNLLFSGSDTVNMFTYSNGTCYPFSVGMSIQFYLRWNGWPSTNQDYDLYLVRNSNVNGSGTWTDVTWSVRDQQNGVGVSPYEGIGYSVATAGCYGFRIDKWSATGNQTLNVLGYNLPYFEHRVQPRSLLDEATSASAFAVAALDVTSPYNREYYSSWGPAYATGGTINDGAAIQQPRIAGYANVSTSFGSFNGTSSAAPHVAGAAALVFGAYPGYSPAQVASFLEGRAMPGAGDSAGYDNTYGFGRLYMGAVPAANTATHTFTPSITPIPTVGPNLVTNGTFDTNAAGWTFENVAAAWSTTASLYFNQGASNQTVAGEVSQVINVPHVAYNRYEMRVRLWSIANATKTLTMQVRSTTGSPVFSCNITLPPNAAAQEYVLRYLPTTGFSSMRVSLLMTGNTTPWVFVDDIVMRQNNTLTHTTTECEGVFNGPTATFTPTFTPSNTPSSTATFTPSHTPSATSSPTPSHTPTSTFTPSYTPSRTPTFTPSNTPVVTPGPNLVTNGTFDTNAVGWSFANVAAGWSSSASIYFNQGSSTQTIAGEVYQVINVPHVANNRYEMRVRLWSIANATKTLTMQVSSTSGTPVFTCNVTLPPNAAAQEYVLRYLPTTGFASMRVSLLMTGNTTPWVFVDDIVVRQNNALTHTTTECVGAPTGPTATFTHTPTPSNTFTPTHTFTPSHTPSVTSSPTPSHTPTSTFTPSHTPSRTPTFTPSNTPVVTPGPNLVTNGTFDTNAVGWSFANVAAGWSTSASIYFNQGSSTQTVAGEVYQVINVPHVAYNRYEMRVRLWSIANATKTLTIQVRSTTGTPLFSCPVTLSPNAAAQEYVLRYLPTTGFASMRVSLLMTGNTTPWVFVDDVVVRQNNALTNVTTECQALPLSQPILFVPPSSTAAPTLLPSATTVPPTPIVPTLLPTATLTPSWTPQPPPGPNLVTNGSFDTDVAGWTLQYIMADWSNQRVQLGRPADAPAYASALLQTINAPTVANQRYELLVQLANASTSSRTVTLMVRDALGWDAATTFACTVTLPPDAPMNTYTLRYRPTVSFGSMVVALIVDGDALPALALDNVIVRTNPNLTNNGTECTVSGLGFTDAPLPVTALDQASLNAYATAWAPVPTATLVPPPTLLPTATAEPTAESTAEPTAEPSLEPTPDLPTPESVPPTLESPTPEATPST